jgi:Rrf2 family protein
MIRLNRTTEYGLLALRHMSQKQAREADSVTSAREVADFYGLPFEILAKTLQRLKDTGLIASAHGARGGYTLQKPLSEITLAKFLELMEGPQQVVACATAAKRSEEVQPGCEFHSRCGIHGPMQVLNARVQEFLSGICLAEITDKMTDARAAQGVQAS